MSADPVPVVTPPAEITEGSLADFTQMVDPYVGSDAPGIVLDLERVDFINSAGLGCLVKVGMRLDSDNRRMALARPAKHIARMLKLIGLDSKLPLFRTVEEAMEFVAAEAAHKQG